MLDARYRDRLGRLNDDGVREIARRLQAGERPAAIARAIGMNNGAARKRCSQIAKAAGIPTADERHLEFCKKVCDRAAAGSTDRQIADTLGVKKSAVASARLKLEGPKYTVLRFTDAEVAEIDRRIIAGDRTPEICRATGCTPSTVVRRKARLAGKINPDGRLCDCGKLRGHRSMCQLLPATIDILRQRLREGAFVDQIARELGVAPTYLRTRYARPIIAELVAEGIRCRCGRQLGHPHSCAAKAETSRNTFTPAQLDQAKTLVRRGSSVAGLQAATGLTLYAAQQITRQVRAMLKAEGVACPCGKPIDHNRGCSARGGERAKNPVTVRFGASGQRMSPSARSKVTRLIRQGWPVKIVCNRTGESEWRVTQVMRDVIAAGAVLPETCPGCTNPRNHRGPCPLPVGCDCGRVRNHRGPCRAPRKPKLPDMDAATRKAVWRRYHDGQSIRKISGITGVPFTTVQRAVAYWIARRTRPAMTCICGRPFRHAGGCIRNTPGALGKRWVARIEALVRAGEMPVRIAGTLGMSIATVLKHSLPLRAQLFDEGVTCGCGRLIAHNHWCSAKWDAWDMPRGPRPLPAPIASIVAERLVRGDRAAEIASAAGIGIGRVWDARRELSSDDRRRRRLAISGRTAREQDDGADMMARIDAAVSKTLDRMIRDDIVSELGLAVIEGRLEVEQIAAAARSFVRRGLSEWQSAYGPKSLDATIGADTTRTLSDLLEDATTAGQLDELMIGAGP